MSNQHRLMVATAAATCIANASWFMQPQIISDLMTSHGASESSAGLMVAGEFFALAVTSFLVARYAGGLSFFRISVYGACVMLAGSLLTTTAGSHEALSLARAITGIGEGAFLLVSTAAVAHLVNPDRAYGQLNTINIIFGVVVTFSVPIASSWVQGADPTFKVLLVILPLLALVALCIPKTERYDPPTRSAHTNESLTRIILLGSAVFLLGIGSVATWSFFVVLGSRLGLTIAQANAVVTISLVVSVPATLLATAIGPRFGRLKPMMVMMVIDIVAIYVMTHTSSPDAFRIGACVMEAGICFLVPYFLGFSAAMDPSGRSAAVAGGGYLLTASAGPYLAGLLMQSFGAGSIFWMFLATNLVSATIFWWLAQPGTNASDPHRRTEVDSSYIAGHRSAS